MYQQTSLFAYLHATQSITKRHEQILKCFTGNNSLNNRQISELTKLPINCVTPRVIELRAAGHLEKAIQAKDLQTGRLTIFWRATAGTFIPLPKEMNVIDSLKVAAKTWIKNQIKQIEIEE